MINRWPWHCGVCGSHAESYTEEGARDALMEHFKLHIPLPAPARCAIRSNEIILSLTCDRPAGHDDQHRQTIFWAEDDLKGKGRR